MKSGGNSARHITLLIVPDDGGSPRRVRISTIWLKIGGAALTLFTLLVILAAISYTSLLTKAMDRDHLVADNARLESENKRVVQLAREFEKNQQSLERIVRSLGGKLDLKVNQAETTSTEATE